MNNLPEVFIGVDISKNNLDIFINPLGKWTKISNTKKDIKQFVKELSQYNVKQIACEATGGYEKRLVKVLDEHSRNCWIVDPRRIKGFIIATGCKSKTDKIDAQKIAEFASKNSPGYEQIRKTSAEELIQSFVNRKGDLIKFLAAEKARLKHPSHETYIENIKSMILFLNKKIIALDKQIAK